MPHAARTRDLGRNRSWRKATVLSLAQALIRSERIRTTLSRAKEAQPVVDRLIQLGKRGDLASRRSALSLLNNDRLLVRRLFSDVAPRFKSRPGGYTRILHNGNRPGDGASMAVFEMVELAPAKLAAGLQEKGKGKSKLKSEPKEAKPAPRKPSKEPAEDQPIAPTAAETPPSQEKPEKQGKTKKPKEEKRKGFIDGLRKFFRGGGNP